jgi:hypothetical protein
MVVLGEVLIDIGEREIGQSNPGKRESRRETNHCSWAGASHVDGHFKPYLP